MRIAFKSRFFIQPILTVYTVGILLFFQVFFISYFPKGVRHFLEVGLSFLYPCIFACVTFYLFFTTYDREKIEARIESLQNESQEKRRTHFRSAGKDQLQVYERLRSELSKAYAYVHCYRSRKEVVDDYSLFYYILIVSMLFFGQRCFDSILPLGPIIFLSLVFISLLVCILLAYWELFHLRNYKWSVSIWIVGVFILLAIAKSFYIQNYGNEVLGSFFEKPEYRTEYFVNALAEGERGMPLKLPARIYVNYESEEIETADDRLGQIKSIIYDWKYIRLEVLYLANGDSLMLDDCLLEIDNEVQCEDEFGTTWYLQLTPEKVR